MKIIKQPYKTTIESYEKVYIKEKTVFLDIETTGLSKQQNHIYMIGLALLENDILNIILLFAESKEEEAEILQEFCHYVKSADTFISFNGLSFDFPFLKERALKYNIDFDPSHYYHIDIYKDIKPLKNLLSLENLKQKTIENFLGIKRDDKFDGGKLINIYHRYEKEQNETDYNNLICHNLEDVSGMINLLTIYRYLQIDKKIKKINTIDCLHSKKFNSKYNKYDFEYKLTIELTCDLKHFVFKSEFYYLSFTNNEIKIILSPQYLELNYYLPDYKNYVYLPSEKIILPKILLNNTNKKDAIKSNRENCFIKEYGYYIPIYDTNLFENEKIFKKSYKSKENFIKIEPYYCDKEFWLKYITHIISNMTK